MIKVVLLKDVPQVGVCGEVKELKDGFVRNFLLPRRLAEIASANKIREIENTKRRADLERQNINNESRKEFAKIAGMKFTIESKSNESGHLFKGISAEDISKFLQKKGFVQMNDGWVILEKPIKETGSHKIKLKHGENEAEIELEINPQRK
ncbi:50S ribosomal protein L9 [Candidatus Giovannonibacteria bacterium]|nr:50S ribosomal protein L9 [Candidatus Giovannonibacteria bacterium]